ncbi:MAG TPA: hypothetical protein VIN09_04175 [Chloroflexota bacterium]
MRWRKATRCWTTVLLSGLAVLAVACSPLAAPMGPNGGENLAPGVPTNPRGIVAPTDPPQLAEPSPITPTRPSAGPASPAPTGGVRVGSVPLDLTTAQRYQQAVDEGHQPWRLDPVQVARVEGEALGFSPQDQFELVDQYQSSGSGTAHAIVRTVHDGAVYEIQLVQPVRVGRDGIWMINDVRRVG